MIEAGFHGHTILRMSFPLSEYRKRTHISPRAVKRDLLISQTKLNHVGETAGRAFTAADTRGGIDTRFRALLPRQRLMREAVGAVIAVAIEVVATVGGIRHQPRCRGGIGKRDRRARMLTTAAEITRGIA